MGEAVVERAVGLRCIGHGEVCLLPIGADAMLCLGARDANHAEVGLNGRYAIERIEHRKRAAAVGATRMEEGNDATALAQGVERKRVATIRDDRERRQRVAHIDDSARSCRFGLIDTTHYGAKQQEQERQERKATQGWYGRMVHQQLFLTHSEDFLNVLLVERLETGQYGATTSLTRHDGEVGGLNADFGECALQSQRIEEEI